MRIAVIGAGALGLLFAGMLCRQNNLHALITGSEGQAQEIRRSGWNWNGEEVHFEHVSSRENPEQAGRLLSGAEIVLVTMKNFAVTAEWLRSAGTWIPSEVPVLFFQNGLGHTERIQAVWKDRPVWLAVSAEAAFRASSCEVRHTGSGGTVAGLLNPVHGREVRFREEGRMMGMPDSGTVITQFADVWHRGGMKMTITANIMPFIWRKWIYNCVINPFTAVERIKNGLLLEKEYWHTAVDLLNEAYRVADAAGAEMPWTFRELEEGLRQICRQTSDNYSSMLSDVMAGKPTEIGSLTGKLLELAVQTGMDAQAHRLMFAGITGKEFSADGMVE